MRKMDDLILGDCLVVSRAIGARAGGKISPLMSGYHSVIRANCSNLAWGQRYHSACVAHQDLQLDFGAKYYY